MQIVANKALLLRTKKGAEITSVIPKSKVLTDYGDVQEVLVRWGLEESIILKNLKIKDVPSPILRDYDWPGMYRPFDHQRQTASFLTLYKRAFCFSEAGTGKTNAAIWAADYLLFHRYIRRVLVICPMSIMQSAWQSDLFKTSMHRTVGVAYGTRKKRQEIIAGSYEFVIINYDGVEVVAGDVAKAGFDLIIVDEANAYKTTSTNRWKVLNKLLTPDKWLWMMTGTPAAQSPFDAYGLAKLVSPDRVPKYASGFKDMVMQRVTQFKWVPRPSATAIVHRALQPAIRYTKEQCLDLPPLLYEDRDTPLGPMQEDYYKKLKRDMLVLAQGEVISAVNAAVVINKLLQVSAGAAYTDGGNVLEFDISNRYKVLKEVIDETPHKLIIFVNFRSVITLLQEKLIASGYTVEAIHGDVTAAKRTDIFNRFQTTTTPRILLIQPQSAAHGVTLHAADTVVWWGPITSAETYLQGNARAHRAGQTKSVTVVHLQGSEVEKRVYKMLRENIDVHQKVVDLYEEIIGVQLDQPDTRGV